MSPPQKKTKVDLGSTSSPTVPRSTSNPASTVPRSTSNPNVSTVFRPTGPRPTSGSTVLRPTSRPTGTHSTTVLPSTASPELRPNTIPTGSYLSPPTGNTSQRKISLNVPLDCIEDDETARTTVTILLELLNAAKRSADAAAAGGPPPNQGQESGVDISHFVSYPAGVHTGASSSSSAGASSFFSVGASSFFSVGASSSSADKLTEHIHQVSAYLATRKLLPVKDPWEASVLCYLKTNWGWGGKGFITPNCLDGVRIRMILRKSEIGYRSSNLEYDGGSILPRSLIDTGLIPSSAIPHSPPATLPLLSRIPQNLSSPSLTTVVTTEIGADVNTDLDLTTAAATSNPPPPTGPN